MNITAATPTSFHAIFVTSGGNVKRVGNVDKDQVANNCGYSFLSVCVKPQFKFALIASTHVDAQNMKQ